jgi:hypothetical protein
MKWLIADVTLQLKSLHGKRCQPSVWGKQMLTWERLVGSSVKFHWSLQHTQSAEHVKNAATRAGVSSSLHALRHTPSSYAKQRRRLCDDRRVTVSWQSFTRWFPLQPTHTRLMHDACDAHTTPRD